MKLDVRMIKNKEQLTELSPFRVEHALWGTREYPLMYGYIGFVPGEAFYLKMISEEKNPLRKYKNANDPVYQDSAMEAFLMFEPESARMTKDIYINLEVNANGALLAGIRDEAYISLFLYGSGA